MKTTFACPICRRSSYLSPASLRTHMVEDHSKEVLADELVKRLHPPACGKVRYPSEAAAMHALLDTWRSKSPQRHERRAYHCTPCDAWHLTSRATRPPSSQGATA